MKLRFDVLSTDSLEKLVTVKRVINLPEEIEEQILGVKEEFESMGYAFASLKLKVETAVELKYSAKSLKSNPEKVRLRLKLSEFNHPTELEESKDLIESIET